MKLEPLLQDLEDIKERLASEAGGDLSCFLNQMDAWLDHHPHPGPVVNSPEELQARLRAREASEPLPPPTQPYQVHDPIIAEIHRFRDSHYIGRMAKPLIMKEEPPKNKL